MHQAQRDEAGVDRHDLGHVRQIARRGEADIHAIEHGDAGILAQLERELAVADVHRDDGLGAAAQQHVGEAAGRRADVHRELAFDREPEMLERGDKLVRSARGELRRARHQRDGSFGIDLEVGLVGRTRIDAHATRHYQALGDFAAVGETAARHLGVEPEARERRR